MRRGVLSYCIFCLMASCGVATIVSSCRDNREEPQAAPRPTIGMECITVPIDGTVSVKVENCSEVSVESAPDIVKVGVRGNMVDVTGVAYGRGDLLLRGDGQRLRCVVEVAGVSVPDLPAVDALPEDLDAQIGDESIRITYGALSLRYDNPGTLFGCRPDGHMIVATSLVTGNMVEFSYEGVLPRVNGGETPVALTATSLKINGENVDVDVAKVVKVKENMVWLWCAPHAGGDLWIVVEISD